MRQTFATMILMLVMTATAAATPVGLRSGTLVAQSTDATPTVDSPLNQALLSKMLELVATKGDERSIPAAFASPLGLGAPGQPWFDREIGAEADGISHNIAIARGADQDVVFSMWKASSLLVFRVHRDGRIVAAYQTKMGVNPPGITMLDLAIAQDDCGNEFKFWAANIDSMLKYKP